MTPDIMWPLKPGGWSYFGRGQGTVPWVLSGVRQVSQPWERLFSQLHFPGRQEGCWSAEVDHCVYPANNSSGSSV